MSFIWILLIGLAAGAVARFLMPGKDPGGFIITIVLGILGAIVFTYLGQFFGVYEEGETAGFIGAVFGAIIILAIYRFFKRRSA